MKRDPSFEKSLNHAPLPLVGITMGDPTGIGPEIIVKALSRKEPFQACRPVVFGDRQVMQRAIDLLSLSTTVEVFDEVPEEAFAPRRIFLIPVTHLDPSSLRFGRPDKACGKAMVRYIEEAVKSVQRRKLKAITTCPINKHAMNGAGYPFQGHTEFLAHLVQSPSVAMMFVGSRWKVILVTTHLPLKEVPRSITRHRLLSIFRMADEGLKRYFRIPRPRIAVLGLNPHCGEGGLLGEEEEKKILPAISEGRSLGLDLEGPFPADSFFNRSGRTSFDVVVSMYHDQGLIPMKISDPKEAVNFTLGLPFIRTSVGHGTAYDIAGKGLADPTNLIEAIRVASHLAQ